MAKPIGRPAIKKGRKTTICKIYETLFKTQVQNPEGATPRKAFLFGLSKAYNFLIDLKGHEKHVPGDLKELNEVTEHSSKRTDISDHLGVLFRESFSAKPKLIVELGVRGGESTFVLERVAGLCSSELISADLQDCSGISKYKKWFFIQKDDIGFAGEFKNWCKKKGIKPEINILFIDTSHEFEHTLKEIKHWFPYLSSKAKVFFHDTNSAEIYFRKDDSMGVGNDHKRGVIKAIEKYFNEKFNEKKDFTKRRKGWLIKHYANCNGFTILEKKKS